MTAVIVPASALAAGASTSCNCSGRMLTVADAPAATGSIAAAVTISPPTSRTVASSPAASSITAPKVLEVPTNWLTNNVRGLS